MKFNSTHKVVLLITFLIILLSFGLSIANYWSAFEQTRKQLRENSLPLSTDNIYADIQKIIIEPSLISSMMSNDTFVRDWFKNEKDTPHKIVEYLDAITKKYGFSNSFLVSDSSKKYYTSNGFLEILSPYKKDNSWYFRFHDQPALHEVNIDSNELIDNNLLLFFNYKIRDDNNNLLGVVGVVFKTSYISRIFHRFKEYYKLKVFLMDRQGNIKLSEQGINGSHKQIDKKMTTGMLPDVLQNKSRIFDYEYNSKQYIIKSKYIEELGLYLVVQAELEEFTGSLQKQLIINLIISLFITLLILIIILRTIMSHTRQLNRFAHHDALTELPNRRTFNDNFKKVWEQYQRNQRDTCLILFDIDNFKTVNDTFGHQIGDKVLIRIAELFNKQARNADYISRWGGEEFSILLIDADLNNAELVAEKLRNAIANDDLLNEIIHGSITASFGITAFAPNDSINDIINRSDVALYEAKQSGKNCVKKASSL